MKRLAVCLCLPLAACATQAKFQQKLQSYVGKDISDFISSNRLTPSNVTELPNGQGKLYLFGGSAYGGTVVMTNAGPGLGFDAAVPLYRVCVYTFATDNQNIIKQYTWRGNACRSR